MTNTRNDLRQGTLWKQILFFSLPIAATSMLQQLFNSADVAVVGRFSAQKDLALAAVGSTSSVVNLFITIITGLAVGANVVIARSIGASDEKRARQAVHTALILSLLCGAILLVLGECIALPLLEIMDTPSDIIGLAGKYLRIYMLGVFFQTIYNFEASILRANGDTRRPLFCLIFSGAVNVVLNLVFVIGFQLDVAGVAIATVLADVVAASTIGVTAEIFVYYLVNSFGQASMTFTGQNYGAGNLTRCRQATKWCLLLGVGLGEAFSLLLVVFGLGFAGLYTTDGAIALLALTRMKWILPFEGFNTIIEILSGTLRGLGYSLVPTILCAAFICGLRILWIKLIFPLSPTFLGLLLVYPASWIAASAALAVAYVVVKKKVLQARVALEQ